MTTHLDSVKDVRRNATVIDQALDPRAKRREYERQWVRRNPEKNRAKTAKYARSEKGQASIAKTKASEKYRIRLANYRRQARENSRRWHHDNIERVRMLKRINEMRRRARKAQATGEATAEAIADRVAVWGWKCWICGTDWEAIDHVIPLAKGGTNWSANLRPICKSCNSAKRDRLIHANRTK